MTVNAKQPDEANVSFDAFSQEISKAREFPSLELDLKALNHPEEVLAQSHLGADQILIMKEQLQENEALFTAAAAAVKKLNETSRCQTAVASLKTYLQTGDPNIDVDGIFLQLLQSEELTEVVGLASANRGLRGLSLGVSADVSFLIPGWGAGADGIWMFPYKVGTTKVPAQFLRRTWTYRSKGIDFLWSAGVTLTFWSNMPVDSDHLLGAFVSAEPLTRVSLFGWIPSVSESELGKLKVLKYIFGVTVGPSFPIPFGTGMELGVGAFHGKQSVNQGLTLSTLSVVNSLTKATNVVIGTYTPAQALDIKLTCPMRGQNPTRIFRNYTSDGTTTQTTLQLSVPLWLQDTMSDMTVTCTNSDAAGYDWVVSTDESSGDFLLTYSGTDQRAWNEDLTFSIANVASDSTTAQSGLLGCTMTNIQTTGVITLETTKLAVSMALVDAAFVGAFDWTITVGTGFTIAVNGTTITDTQYKGTCTAGSTSSSASDSASFTDVVDADNNTVTVTDSDGYTWRLGYVFNQDMYASVPTSQLKAIWWRQGSYTMTSGNSYPSDYSDLSSTDSQPITAYYNNSKNSPSYFTIDATATAVYDNSASKERAART